jgi:RNA polymerase sigma-70 factor (ECF subfamily)
MIDSTSPQKEATRLLLKHHLALYSYIYACVRSHHDTEDILQNVSLVVIESFHQLREEAGFLPWAREIARRCSLAHGRKRRREQVTDPELMQRLAEAAHEMDRECSEDQHREALLACLEKLSEENRALLMMRYDGSAADAGELASRFGRSVQGIYAMLKRIKAALRVCVQRRLHTECEP